MLSTSKQVLIFGESMFQSLHERKRPVFGVMEIVNSPTEYWNIATSPSRECFQTQGFKLLDTIIDSPVIDAETKRDEASSAV